MLPKLLCSKLKSSQTLNNESGCGSLPSHPAWPQATTAHRVQGRPGRVVATSGKSALLSPVPAAAKSGFLWLWTQARWPTGERLAGSPGLNTPLFNADKPVCWKNPRPPLPIARPR